MIIDNAIRDLSFRIGDDVLMEVFNNKVGPRLSNLHSRIMDVVVRPRVLRDINAVTANRVEIPVNSTMFSDVSSYGFVLCIPREVIGDTEIIEPLALLTNTLEAGDGNAISTKIELIGSNTMFVHASTYTYAPTVLQANVTYTDGLEELPRGVENDIMSMVYYAVSSYVHTRLRYRINTAAIYNGAEMTEIKTIIDEYADSEEKYQEFKEETLRKILFMSKRSNMDEFIQAMIPII